MSNKVLLSALVATTFLTGSLALAANEPAAAPSGQGAVLNDFGKLSTDAAQGYQDLTLTRLAIFDGRINDAKKFVTDADTAFGKAKTDNSVFTKAEADLRAQAPKASGQNAAADQSGNGSAQTDTSNVPAASNGQSTANAQPTSISPGSPSTIGQAQSTPIAWLPVDGAISVAEDYTMQPAKAKAVADANKSLASGDRKGAMDTLKLAGVDLNAVIAVVPLQRTLDGVHDAVQMINAGKFYEGSQKLRAVQSSAVLVIANMQTQPSTARSIGKAATDTPQGQAMPMTAQPK